jgi:hypothetical protein
VLNIAAAVVLTVSVTGRVCPGASVTNDGLNVAEAAFVQETFPAAVHVQLPGRCAVERVTFPENAVLAAISRSYTTEFPGITVWLCCEDVMANVGATAGTAFGTEPDGQNVMLYPGFGGGEILKSLDGSSNAYPYTVGHICFT